MAKFLKIAALVVGAIALVATGLGALAGTAFGGSLFGSTVGAAIAKAAFAGIAKIATIGALGLSVGAALAQKRPDAVGSALKIKADPNAGIPVVMGRTATGGNIIYRKTGFTPGYTTAPDLQFIVAVLSLGPIDAVEAFTFDKTPVTFSSGVATGEYANYMFQTVQLGQTPESAELKVCSTGTYASVVPPEWSSASKLSGKAATMWTLRFDTKGKLYSQGTPVPLWVVRGIKVYDPRLDSTYPGGSGACRFGDQATWVYSENPFLHGLAFAIGAIQNGKRVAGIGLPATGIDIAAFVEGANVCDANGWTCGGVYSTADDKWTVLKAILQAGGGEPMHLGAKLSCMVNAPKVSLATITNGDIVGSGSNQTTQSRRERINSILPRYRSEEHNWEEITAKAVTVAAHVTTDGGLRTREVAYSYCQDLDQAAQLARYDIENGREFGPITLPLKTRFIGYKPGDCLTVTVPELGLGAQKVVITNREIEPASAVVTLTARSETDGKHAFALGQTTTAPPTPTIRDVPSAPRPGASDWTISGSSLSAAGAVVPAIAIAGEAVNAAIDGIVFEYRRVVSGAGDDDNWISAGIAQPDTKRREIADVIPGESYQASISYTLNGFSGPRRIIGPVRVGLPEAGDNLVINSGLAVDAGGWVISTGVTRVAGAAGDPAPGYFQFGTGAGRKQADGGFVPISGAAKLFVSLSGWKASTASLAGGDLFGLQIRFQKADGSAASVPTVELSAWPGSASTWTKVAYTVAVPADAALVAVRAVSDATGGNSRIAAVRVASTQQAADVTADVLADTATVFGSSTIGDVIAAAMSGAGPAVVPAVISAVGNSPWVTFTLPAGGSIGLAAEVYANLTATRTVTIALEYQIIGGSLTGFGSSGSDSGGPGDTVSASATGTITNGATEARNYQARAVVSSGAGGVTIDAARSFIGPG